MKSVRGGLCTNRIRLKKHDSKLFGAFQYYFDLIAVSNVLYFEQRILEESL